MGGGGYRATESCVLPPGRTPARLGRARDRKRPPGIRRYQDRPAAARRHVAAAVSVADMVAAEALVASRRGAYDARTAAAQKLNLTINARMYPPPGIPAGACVDVFGDGRVVGISAMALPAGIELFTARRVA